MARKKPIEKQTLRVFEFGNKPLIYRRYENYVSCGVPTDVGDPSSKIDSLTIEEAEALIADGTISGGMIPKVEACMNVLKAGVGSVRMVDGRSCGGGVLSSGGTVIKR